MYRMTRSRILSLREEEYVQAMKAFGLHDIVICFKHILPNAIGPIAVNITLSTAMFILRIVMPNLKGLENGDPVGSVMLMTDSAPWPLLTSRNTF